ncbi:hypothetical protein [Alcaligenes faecalis]|uniref:hypothetical protein n=1 Tax=Alcaligenes faecalis TaxID=511 RepID=UPI000B17AB98|nr:hypothetical protein [Alcaligenes faecalis]
MRDRYNQANIPIRSAYFIEGKTSVCRIKFIAAILLAAACSFFTLPNALAMNFSVVTLRGEPAIIGQGEIVEGDAARLKAVLTLNAMNSYGYFALVLDSPGGSVLDAFEIAQVMDEYYVNTYIRPGDECVSACAAIVFIAGREHVAVSGSYLGFHGCFNTRDLSINSMCNEVIAEHAVAHGTAYGAVMAFIENIPATQVVWVSGDDADCWGINRYDISPEPPSYQQCIISIMQEMLQ